MKYRAEIDGLRALAVLPVIFFHAGFELFKGGFVGVDVFFVISGYLITTIIISEISEGKFSITNFYERRARRILPALFFMMMVCLPFAWFWLPPLNLKEFGQSLIAVSIFSSNILFWTESGYFDTASELKPLLHTWSLAIEEQYYIFFPIFLVLIWRLGLKWILSILIIIFLISLGFSHWLAYYAPNAAFYFLPSRAWELLIGVFTAFYLKNNYIKSNSLNQALSLLGFGMIAYAIFIFDESILFPSLYTLIPTIGTSLLILSASPNTLIYKFLSFSPIVKIGLISYSAYLWHQPILVFARHRLLEELPDFLLLVLCFSSLVLAYISWRWVEGPFRKKIGLSRRTVLNFTIFGSLFFIIIGFVFNQNNGIPKRANFKEELINSFVRPTKDGCVNTAFNHIDDQWGCYLGASKEKVDYILFGDSHAYSLKKVVNDIGKKNKVSIFYTGAAGCIPFLGLYPKRDDQYENNCKQLNDRVVLFAKENNIKGLVLASRWSYYTNGKYGNSDFQLISTSKEGPYSQVKSVESFKKGFELTLQKYRNLNIPLHIISQAPHQYRHPQNLYFSINKGFGTIEGLSVKRSDFMDLERTAKDTFMDRLNDINYYDVIDNFCNEQVCDFGNSLESYYYDDNHLSISGANRLRGIIDNIFK